MIYRHQWVGQNHLTIFGALEDFSPGPWKPLHIVIDATGVGEGLYAMLDRQFAGRVIPVHF